MRTLQFRSAVILLMLGFSTATWAQTTPPKAAPIRLKLPALSPTFPPLSADPNTIVGLATDVRGRLLESVQVTVRRVLSVATTGDLDKIHSPVTQTQDSNRGAWATAHGGTYGTTSEIQGDSSGIKSQDQTNTWSGSISFTPSRDQHLVTDVGGRYEASVQTGNYRIDAAQKISFDGATFIMPLCPTDQAHDLAIADGGSAVENFVWRLSGLKPGADPDQVDSYYGAHLWLKTANERNRPSSKQIEIVLIPVGPLADGSAAAPLTFQCVLGDKAVCWKDIPLGQYTAKATLIRPDGLRQPLLMSTGSEGKAAQEALPIHFRPLQDGTPEAALSVAD